MDCGESLPCLAVFLQNIDLVTRVWGVFTSIGKRTHELYFRLPFKIQAEITNCGQ